MLGWGEIIVIILALILIGHEELPKIARTLARLYFEYQKTRREIELEVLYGSLEDEKEDKKGVDKHYEYEYQDYRSEEGGEMR